MHYHNKTTINNFIESHLPKEYTVIEVIENCAKIQLDDKIWAVYANADGSFTDHKVRFELLN